MRNLQGLRLCTLGIGLAALLVAAFPMTTRGGSTPKPKAYTTWHAFGGTSDSMQYSAFTQINKTNVSELEQVWSYPVIGRAELAFSLLIVGSVMYVAGKGERNSNRIHLRIV